MDYKIIHKIVRTIGVLKMWKKHKIKIISALAISGIFFYYTTTRRIATGYYTNPFWITIDEIAWIIFFGLMTGTALAYFSKKLK